MLWTFLECFLIYSAGKYRKDYPSDLKTVLPPTETSEKTVVVKLFSWKNLKAPKGALGSKNGFFHAKNISGK